MDTDEELIQIARSGNRAWCIFISVCVLLDIVTLIVVVALYNGYC